MPRYNTLQDSLDRDHKQDKQRRKDQEDMGKQNKKEAQEKMKEIEKQKKEEPIRECKNYVKWVWATDDDRRSGKVKWVDNTFVKDCLNNHQAYPPGYEDEVYKFVETLLINETDPKKKKIYEDIKSKITKQITEYKNKCKDNNKWKNYTKHDIDPNKCVNLCAFPKSIYKDDDFGFFKEQIEKCDGSKKDTLKDTLFSKITKTITGTTNQKYLKHDSMSGNDNIINDIFFEKYILYKKKYLDLQSQLVNE